MHASQNAKVETINVTVPEHQDLLNSLFEPDGLFGANGLYERQFPDIDEREEPEAMKADIESGDAQLVLTMRTASTGVREIVGMAFGRTYLDKERHGTGLITYITKDNMAENRHGEKYKSYHMRDGLLKAMDDALRAAGAASGLEAIFWEANDPACYAAKEEAGREGKIADSMSPALRRAIITGTRAENVGEGWCFEEVGGGDKEAFHYWLPPLKPGDEHSDAIGLFAAKVEKSADKPILKPGLADSPEGISIVQGFLPVYYDTYDMRESPKLRGMLEQLNSMKRKLSAPEKDDFAIDRQSKGGGLPGF